LTSTIAEKRARFAELHAAPGCFVIPNPFDIGSAKYLASLGFQALASTSAGMAFAAGKGDGAVDRAYALSHIRDLAEATDLPLNADFEAGFARDAEGVYESARLCVGAGVSGFSIEDYTGDPRAPLYSLTEAVERLRAARAAIDASGQKVLLTARSEAILRQAGGLPEAWGRPPPPPGRRDNTPSRLRGSRRRRSLRAIGEDWGRGLGARARRGKAAGQCAGRRAGLHQARA
jgi:2-methylisocitrate lyase-like PEP mutase family enzyme